MPKSDATNDAEKAVKKPQGGKATNRSRSRSKPKAPDESVAAEAVESPVGTPLAKDAGGAGTSGVKYVSILTRSGIYLEDVDEDEDDEPLVAAAEVDETAAIPLPPDLPDDDDDDAVVPGPKSRKKLKREQFAPPVAPVASKDDGKGGKPEPLRRPDLVNLVVTDTDLSAGTVRTVLDSVLRMLSDALRSEKDVVLPPLGKLMVKSIKEGGNGQVMTLRLSQSAPKETK